MADYNINAVTRRVVYTGSAGLGPYAFSFEVLVNTDVAVYFNSTLLTLTTDYTVAISANGTGSVSVVTGTNVPTTPDADDQITIVGDRAIERTTDFVTAGDLRAASLNEQLDALTIFDQQLAESADRAVKAPITDPTSIDMTLPVKATRATKALGFDSDGDPVVSTLTLAAMEAGSTDAAASATAAATSATAAASSATAAASSATSAASSATSAASSAGTQSVDRFNGTGSQTAFTLSSAPSTENNTSVYISGVYQQKDTYAVSGTTLTFSAAPPSGTGNIEVMHLSTQSIGVDPSIGSVTTGAAGSSAAVSITSGGVLSFTIPQGDDGATGSTGSTGATGSAATVAVGSTTTGAAGSSAAVTNVGSSSAATFNFTIPQGDTGTTGTAATIAVGTVTTGAAGSSATVVNGGSSSAATFNFAIPRGDTGATGSTGATGTAATIAAGTATGLSVGASPTVTNSGSSSAATFDFGIPVGATGATGSAATIAVGSVTTGAAGSSATVTNVGSSSAATFDFAIPQGAAGVGSGDVTGPSSATDNAIARYDATTGKLLQNSTVTVSDAGAVAAASLTLTTDLAIADGGTGSSTASAARTALGVDPAGTDNSTNVTLAGSLDYLTLSGQEITRGAIVLTTDVSGTLPVANGGSGATSLTDGGILLGSGTGAITAMAVLTDGQMIVGDGTGDPVAESGATLRASIGVDAAGTDNSTDVTLAGSLDYLTISGQEITRGAIVLTTDVSGTLPIANGGTNATSAGAARTALGAAASGANSDITSITGLTTDLTVAQGGTGAGTFAANGILFGNGTSAIGATAVGTSGHVLTSNGSGVAPTFQAAGGGGASDIDGLSDGMTSAAGKNLSLGTDALAALGTSDLSSTAVGYKAGESVAGGRGTFVGHLAGADLNSWSNTVVGAYSAQTHTGGYNTLVGAQVASAAAGLMEYNTIVGANAGDNITTGGNSTLVGYTAGAAITTSSSHALVGYQSGNAITTGNFHTALGRQANTTGTTGQQTVVIGYNAQPSSATVSHEITLGNSSVATLRCQVTSISSLSDRRDKKDIVPLTLGLDFINSLNPVKFTWDMRDGAKVGQQEAGFIAQELDEAQIAAGAEDYLDIVLKENPDKLEAAPGKLIPVLVRAIQDLSAEVATLRNQVNGA